MESKTYIKNLRISPRKLRFLLPEIKKFSPSEAMTRLLYMPNSSAKIFYKSLKSAVTNAKNVLKSEEKLLKFKHLSVEEGQKLKRYKAGSRGTAKPILRRFAHIKIILEAVEPKAEKKPITEVQKQIEAPKSKVKVQKSKRQVKSNNDTKVSS